LYGRTKLPLTGCECEFEAHEAHESGFREDKYKERGYEDRLMKKIWIGFCLLQYPERNAANVSP
jgi:hypothetical protein